MANLFMDGEKEIIGGGDLAVRFLEEIEHSQGAIASLWLRKPIPATKSTSVLFLANLGDLFDKSPQQVY